MLAAVVACLVFFLAALAVLLVLLWRQPRRLGEAIVMPLADRLDAVAVALRQVADVQGTHGARLDAHQARLVDVERRLRQLGG